MLWRFPAYDGPGFPSPTTNQTGSVIGSSREPRPFRTRSDRRRIRGRASLPLGLLLGLARSALGLLGALGLHLGLLALDADLGLGLGELLLDLLGGRGVGHVDDQVVVVDEDPRAARHRQVLGQDLVADVEALDG